MNLDQIAELHAEARRVSEAAKALPESEQEAFIRDEAKKLAVKMAAHHYDPADLTLIDEMLSRVLLWNEEVMRKSNSFEEQGNLARPFLVKAREYWAASTLTRDELIARLAVCEMLGATAAHKAERFAAKAKRSQLHDTLTDLERLMSLVERAEKRT